MSSGSPSFTLHLERVLPASRTRVFRAATDPAELAEWWGPRGFTAPSVDLDLRAGGRYRIVMQPPEGERFHLSGTIREVEPPARLVYTFRWEEPHPHDRETTVAFTLGDAGGGTLVVVDQGVFATDERLELHRQGWTESLDRLVAYLSRPADGPR